MLKLDHVTVIAPTLAEGVAHVRDCLDLDVPFGTRHRYMGTQNHRLQLGDQTYLEIVSHDPQGVHPGHARWFGLDDPKTVRRDWEDGRRLRGWVASTTEIKRVIADHAGIFGAHVSLPSDDPEFGFSIAADGSLPLDGAAPSLIDHRGAPTLMSDIPDMGARLIALTLQHPDPKRIQALYETLHIDRHPTVTKGPQLRYVAQIETGRGIRTLT